jgi:hypothetical protein
MEALTILTKIQLWTCRGLHVHEVLIEAQAILVSGMLGLGSSICYSRNLPMGEHHKGEKNALQLYSPSPQKSYLMPWTPRGFSSMLVVPYAPLNESTCPTAVVVHRLLQFLTVCCQRHPRIWILRQLYCHQNPTTARRA